MTNYPVGDFLIRVKNAAMAGNKTASAPAMKEILAISQSLKKLGFLEKVEKGGSSLKVSIAFKNKKPRLLNLKLVSKPGLRIYLGVKDLEKKKGPSVFLLSTPKGIISSKEALKLRVGGEVIAEVM